MHTLTLTPQAHPLTPTRILIGSGAMNSFSDFHQTGDIERVVVLFDEGVKKIAQTIAESITGSVSIGVKSGDASKSLVEADRIVTEMLDAGCLKKTLLIAVGGGMLTDLSGFVASIFMRGIPCVLVPTTSLGMIDAAIGGKTAVNAGSRKNMIGTITQPLAVLADIDLLLTLPEKQLKEGVVEAVKIAAIADEELFSWFESSLHNVLARDPAALTECVARSVAVKIKIVEEDTRDTDRRLLLNFGHTVGHAVEALSKFSLSHGEAVAIGMVAEMQMSGFADSARVLALLEQLHMPTELPAAMKSKKEALWNVMLTDKKNVGGEVRMAVPDRIGSGSVHVITDKAFTSLFA